MDTNEIFNFFNDNWHYVIGGAALGAVIYGVIKNKIINRNDEASQYSAQTVGNYTSNAVKKESSKEEYPIKDISQLLTQKEVTDDVYTLKAKVDEVHSNTNGYAGILSDATDKIPFCYDSSDSISDAGVGVLLHQSENNQSRLELHVEIYSHLDDRSSRVVNISKVSGKIGDRLYVFEQ